MYILLGALFIVIKWCWKKRERKKKELTTTIRKEISVKKKIFFAIFIKSVYFVHLLCFIYFDYF